MFKNIITKTIFDKKSFMIGWSLGVSLMAIITIAFFPSIKDQMGQLLENIPKGLQSITGNMSDYKNIAGYVASGVLGLRITMLTAVMGIILGINLGVTDENTGKLYQLLAQPISRSKVVVHKWLAMFKIFTVVCLGLSLSIYATVLMIGENIEISKLAASIFMVLLLTQAIGSISYTLGIATGRRGLAIFASTSYVFFAYILTSLTEQVDWLKKVEPISLFHYYKSSEVMKYGLDVKHVAVLILLSLVVLFFANILFNRRDIGTHGLN